MIRRMPWVSAWVILALAGCAHYSVNVPLGPAGASPLYRFPEMSLERLDPADELFVCLSFSGGGTRAAAFSYGALLAVPAVPAGGVRAGGVTAWERGRRVGGARVRRALMLPSLQMLGDDLMEHGVLGVSWAIHGRDTPHASG